MRVGGGGAYQRQFNHHMYLPAAPRGPAGCACGRATALRRTAASPGSHRADGRSGPIDPFAPPPVDPVARSAPVDPMAAPAPMDPFAPPPPADAMPPAPMDGPAPIVLDVPPPPAPPAPDEPAPIAI